MNDSVKFMRPLRTAHGESPFPVNRSLLKSIAGSWLTPAVVAFLGSLILSAIGIADSTSVNRDGMLYVDAATAFASDGMHGARERFDWLFLPILMGGVAKLTGLAAETAGYLLCALLMAGTCGLLVRCTERIFPTVAWAACLVVLGMPAFNGYRDHIIREFGYWFFCVLACWFAIRWGEGPRWTAAVGSTLALAVAAAFRVEAVALYPALLLWQFHVARSLTIGRRTIMLGLVPGLALVLALLGYAVGWIEFDGRISGYLGSIDIVEKVDRFGLRAERMADSVLNHYSRDSAWYILLFGLLMMIPVKFLSMLGIFAVPLGYAFARWPMRALFTRWQPFGWLFVAYAVVLALFTTDAFFVSGRYVSFLNLLAVPIIALGLKLLLDKFPRGRPAVVAIAVVAMLANVISLSPGKTQYVEAGAWLQAHPVKAGRMYIESRRAAYHAGLGYPRLTVERDAALRDASEGKYDLLVLEGAPVAGDEMDSWLATHGLELLARFHGSGPEIVVLAPRATVANGAAR